MTVAAGRFAPGHLGELTGVVPFELVDAVLAETRTVQRRLRDLEAVLYTTEPLRDLPAGVEQTEFPHANKESFRSVTSGCVSSSNQTADCFWYPHGGWQGAAEPSSSCTTTPFGSTSSRGDIRGAHGRVAH